MLGGLSGCEKEEAPLLKQKTEVDIFSQVGSNPLIQQITRSLQQHGDTAAYRKTFVQEYGVPLWMKAKCLEQGGTYTAIVPLQEYGRSYLQGLWIFTIKDGKMRYNVAVNDACMPYYEAFKPFFCGIEQSLFNVRRDSIRYKEVVDPRKNGFWVTETYCYNYSVSWGAETVYKQSCYDRSVWVQLDDQHFPMDDGGGGILDLPLTGIGSTGAPDPNPEVDDPFLKCDGVLSSEPNLVLAEISPEPKWGQLASLKEINIEFQKIRDKNIAFDKLRFSNQLETMQKHFEGNRSFTRNANNEIVDDLKREGYASVDRYIYTTEGGWIDLNHFFVAAEMAEKTCLRTAISYTTLAELIQDLKESPSAYSYEDLPSNRFGAEFWLRNHKDIKAGKLTVVDAVNNFLRNLGATNPEYAPNYNFIPHIVDGYVPKNESDEPMIGRKLAEAAQREYCKKDKKTRNAIRKAHNTISHSSNIKK